MLLPKVICYVGLSAAGGRAQILLHSAKLADGPALQGRAGKSEVSLSPEHPPAAMRLAEPFWGGQTSWNESRNLFHEATGGRPSVLRLASGRKIMPRGAGEMRRPSPRLPIGTAIASPIWVNCRRRACARPFLRSSSFAGGCKRRASDELVVIWMSLRRLCLKVVPEAHKRGVRQGGGAVDAFPIFPGHNHASGTTQRPGVGKCIQLHKAVSKDAHDGHRESCLSDQHMLASTSDARKRRNAPGLRFRGREGKREPVVCFFSRPYINIRYGVAGGCGRMASGTTVLRRACLL